MRASTACAWILLAMMALTASGGEAAVSFVTKPAVVQAGDKVTIGFAVSARTDVEVSILGAEGKVVRHLAAGVLGGEKPPPAPLKPGLAQDVVWDGRDDADRPAAGGPFKVRVRAGMGVKFGRIIGGSPYTGTSESLALDDAGNLYVLMQTYNRHCDFGLITRHVRVFDRDGKYIRTILPYPAATSPEKAPGMTLLASGDPGLCPANMGSMYPCFFSFGESLYHRTVDGALLFIHGKSRAHDTDGLIAFKLDGSNAVERRHVLWSKTVPLSRYLKPQLAFSNDGRYAYISGTDASGYDDKTPEKAAKAGFPIGRIYRQDLKAGKDPEAFHDLELPDWEKTKYWIPDAWRKKTATAGIDVGPTGHVFVGDMVNQQVVELSPEGKKLSVTEVPWPDRVHVHHSTGDLYVVSKEVSKAGGGPATLYKLSGRGEGSKVVAKLVLPRGVGTVSAFDPGGKHPALWIAGYSIDRPQDTALIKVEDRGAELVVVKENILNPEPAIRFLTYMDVDPEAELVYVTDAAGHAWRYNGETGEGGLLKGIKATDIAVAPDGMVYTYADNGGYGGPVGRYTRDLKPAPLAATGKHQFGEVYGRWGKQSAVGGLDVDARGRVYVVWGQNRGHIRVYEPDGKLVDYPRKADIYRMNDAVIGKEPVLVDGLSGYGLCIRTDPAGNVYVGQKALPNGHVSPKGFEKDPAYPAMVGAVYKFGPKGGALKYNGYAAQAKITESEDVEKVYAGLAPISGWHDQSVCACTRPRFDVDGFGRLYIPNAVTFKVSVRDNAGNVILDFGGYSNYDSQGPDSAQPLPDVPMGWPNCVGASNRHIYVGDHMNHRVVRADKVWTAEEMVGIGK